MQNDGEEYERFFKIGYTFYNLSTVHCIICRKILARAYIDSALMFARI